MPTMQLPRLLFWKLQETPPPITDCQTCFQLARGSTCNFSKLLQEVDGPYGGRQFPLIHAENETKLFFENTYCLFPQIWLARHSPKEQSAHRCLKSAVGIWILLKVSGACRNAVYRKWAIYFIIQILDPFTMPPKKISDLENCREPGRRWGGTEEFTTAKIRWGAGRGNIRDNVIKDPQYTVKSKRKTELKW